MVRTVADLIEEINDEYCGHESEVYDSEYHTWESQAPCSECGSKIRHGVPAEWVACGSCGNENP